MPKFWSNVLLRKRNVFSAGYHKSAASRATATDPTHHIARTGEGNVDVKKGRDGSATNASKWTYAIAGTLQRMLEYAGYTETSVVTQLNFFSKYVAPILGPFIDEHSDGAQWQSFMTDSHTPIELSWSWSASAKLPQVRYSVDPIPNVFTKKNNASNIEATREFLRKSAPSIPGLKTDLYDYMLRKLCIDSHNAANIPRSQQFLGFDLKNHEVALKAYFLPQRRVLQSGLSTLDLTKSTMKQITFFDSELENAMKVMLDYLSLDSTVHLETEIIAIDCAEARKSRIKIYFRTRNTSLSSVLDVMTLGGRLPALSPENERSLRELWISVLNLRSDEQKLRSVSHRTAGILYYMEFRLDTHFPKPKLYIPVRHYGINDYRIAHGLSQFLEKRGKGFANGTTYLQGVQRLYSLSESKPIIGLHTYVSVAVDGHGLSVNSYIDPGIGIKRRQALSTKHVSSS